MTGETKIIIGAALCGMLLAALMPGGFSPEAWLFGTGLGLAQSLFGVRAYRVALARSTFAFGPALASGFLRIAVLLLALGVALALGVPPAPFAWSLLTMYSTMMVAEVLVVARLLNPPLAEAC
ncbi:MAG TPA: hypothetical protein PKE12_05945 [Kiritimatiellia bacterium]|nr:hypothetical protein [Kiritimatiellia bacterium]